MKDGLLASAYKKVRQGYKHLEDLLWTAETRGSDPTGSYPREEIALSVYLTVTVSSYCT